MSERKDHIKVLKQFLKDYQEWGESLELEESVKFAINSLEVDELYQLEYEKAAYITLDELKEIREEINGLLKFTIDDSPMTLVGLNGVNRILDKRISELEGKE